MLNVLTHSCPTRLSSYLVRRVPRPMIPVAEALDRILGDVEPLPAEQVSLLDGLGRVLATDVTARRTQPPMAVSAMDGYAVRSADIVTVPDRKSTRLNSSH